MQPAAQPANARPAVGIAPYALAAGALCVAAFGIGASVATSETRGAIFTGLFAAALAGAVALAAVALGVRRGVQGLLAGFGVGFLARMVAVAAGLIGSGAKGHVALLYVASFFAVYAITQAVEIAYVWASSRAAVRAASDAKA